MIASYMLPFHLLLIPLFLLMIDLKLIDTHLGVIMPLWAHPFGLFFMRQYMLSIPQDLSTQRGSTGRLNMQCSSGWWCPWSSLPWRRWRCLFALESWNDLLWPLIVMRSPENLPLTLGIASLLGGQFRPRWDLVVERHRCWRPCRSWLVFLWMRKRFLTGFGPDRHWREVGRSFGGTLAPCDPFGTPSTSRSTGAAIIVRSRRTKSCTVTPPRASRGPTPSSSAG